jgi:hypothetical protein
VGRRLQQALAANVDLAKDLVSRCLSVARQVMDHDLLGTTEDLDNVINNISNELSRLPASAYVSSRFQDAGVSGHLEVVRSRHDLYDQRSVDGHSEGDTSMIVAIERTTVTCQGWWTSCRECTTSHASSVRSLKLRDMSSRYTILSSVL